MYICLNILSPYKHKNKKYILDLLSIFAYFSVEETALLYLTDQMRHVKLKIYYCEWKLYIKVELFICEISQARGNTNGNT